MSDRSTFPEGVVVHQKQMVFESTQRQLDSKRILTNGSSRGVVSGLQVTVNVGAPTTIDVAAGTAYSADGSFMQLLSARVNLSITNTLNTINYVCLVYDETQTDYEAHKYNGMTKATRATNTPRVVVMTQSAYNALPATTGQLALTSNTKDRIAIIGIVTGTGGNLTSTNIQMPDEYNAILSSSQTVNITGVTILDISPDTLVGQGTLTFTSAGTTLSWQAPGEGSPGSAVAITTSQTYTLTSSGGNTLLVDVAVSVLPTVNASDIITISDLYASIAPRFTMIDAQHRSMLGSGAVSQNNPHGMTLDDLAPGAAGSLVEHQDIMHSNGFGKGSSTSSLSVTVNTGTAPDTMTVSTFSAGDSLYINGRRITSISGSNALPAPSTAFATTQQIYITQDGVIGQRNFAAYTTGNLNADVQVLDVVGNVTNTVRIQLVSGGGSTRYIQYDDGSGTYNTTPTLTVPSVDSIMKLPGLSTKSESYAYVYVKGGTTTVASETYTISPPGDQIYILATVPWSGTGTGFLGYGFGAGSSPNKTFDLRSYGTLTLSDVNNKSGIGNTQKSIGDIIGDGVTYRPVQVNAAGLNYFEEDVSQLTVTGTSLTPTLLGGSIIVNGKIHEIKTQQLTLANNTTNRVYVTEDGVVGVSNLTTGQIYTALNGKQFSVVAQLTTSGGVITVNSDFRRSASLHKGVPYGVVGLDSNNAISVFNASGSNVFNSFTSTSPTVVIGSTASNGLVVTTESAGKYAQEVQVSDGARGLKIYPIGTPAAGGGMLLNIDTEGMVPQDHGVLVDIGTDTNNTALRVGTSGGVTQYIINNFMNEASQTALSVIGVGDPVGSAGTGIDVTVTEDVDGIKVTAANGTPITAISTAAGKCIDAIDGDITAIAGNMIVDPSFNYRYSTPRTRKLMMSMADFTIDINSGNESYEETNQVIYVHGSDAGRVLCHAEVRGIPHGAVITGVKVCVENTDGATRSVIAGLHYTSHANDLSLPTRTQVCAANLSVVNLNTTYWQSLGAVANNTIGNGRSYFVRLDMEQCTNGLNLKVWGIEITYTYDTEEANC